MGRKVFVEFLCLSFSLLLILHSANASWRHSAGGAQRLRVGYYGSTCPRAEEIVRNVVRTWHRKDPSIAAGILRLHFHDCWLRGCEGSILLDTTPSGLEVEKDDKGSMSTMNLNSFNIIDIAKYAVESECPKTVSCSDILTFAARDAIVLSGFRNYSVPSGRRDGIVSIKADGFSVPPPTDDIDLLLDMFRQKGFSAREMVVLSGAHSIGGAHCKSFDEHLFDVIMNSIRGPQRFMENVHKMCRKRRFDFIGGKVALDFESPRIMDNKYYVGLQKKRGLLASDQGLMDNRKTRGVVELMAREAHLWEEEFIKAMVKLGNMDVLVGKKGQIRRHCRRVNRLRRRQI